MIRNLFKFIGVITIIMSVLGITHVFANTASMDPVFDTGLPVGFDNIIKTSYIQTDGKILIGGNFTSYNGFSINRIVRLNSDGTRDSSFIIGNGFNALVSTLAIQTDGKILVGGQFTSYSGFSINRIVRLNSDGTRDSSLNIGNGFNNVVRTINIQNDNRILVGGNFTSYSGFSINRIVRLNSNGTRDSSFNIGNGFNNYVKTINIQNDNRILVGGNFTSYGQLAAGYLISLYGNSDLVVMPNSTDINAVKNEFINKGYTQLSGDFIGSKAISLSETNGNIPISLNIKNQNIKLSLAANTQFKESDNITNYNGVISVPISKYIESVNDESVISAFKVGSSLQSIKLTGGTATLSIPVPGKNIGSIIDIYYSEDNGVTWYVQTTTTVVNIGGEPYVQFTTTHFTDFAITLPGGSFTGTFVINNDAISTTSSSVTLNNSTTPTASKMRFADTIGGLSSASRENYATTKSWNLPGTTGTKIVYVQFDLEGDGISDVQTSDSIEYVDSMGGGGCAGGQPGTACLSLKISSVTGECRYGENLDLGNHLQTYNSFNMTGAFTGNNPLYPLRRSCNDTAGISPVNWNMQISSTDLIATGSAGNQYIISSDQIEIKTDVAKVYQGDPFSFTGLIGDFASRGNNLTVPKILFRKTSPAGTVGELGTDSVDLRVIVPTNQSLGQYKATITIAFPQM